MTFRLADPSVRWSTTRTPSDVAAAATACGIAALAALAIGVATVPAGLFFPVLAGVAIVGATVAGLAGMMNARLARPLLMVAATFAFIGIAAMMIGDPDHAARLFITN